MNKSIILLVMMTAVGLSATAYNDYRNARVDSLETALKSKNPPKGIDLLRAYDELMRGYLPFDSVKASYYGHKALALSYKYHGLRVRQDVLRRFAQMYYGREEFDEAIRIFRQALAVVDTMEHVKRYTQSDIDDARSCLYGAIGNVYNMQDKAHLAIYYYQLALPIFEKHNWLESQTILYHNIGELYYLMGNVPEAERYYLMGLRTSKKTEDPLMVALSQKGLLRLYIRQNDYGKACQLAEPCYNFYYAHRTEEVENYHSLLATMVRLNLMDGHKNMVAAKKYVQDALPMADSLQFENRSDVYAAACELAMEEKQWQQALHYGLKTIHPDSLTTSSDADCYALLAEIYTELSDKEQARHYIHRSREVMSRYATDHYQSGLSQMQVLYETEKKEAQIAALNEQHKRYHWMLFAAVCLIALLVVLFVYRHVAHRRQKALFAAKVALETETKERHILARDLHDGLGGMLSLLKLKIDDDAPKEQVLKLLDNTSTELRRTAHHLMPEQLLRNGLAAALHDFSISIPGASFQTIGYIQLDHDRQLMLYRCAYELVNNAMKHAYATHIVIQLMQEQSQVTLTVSDNGKGITEDSNGMGLQNIRERIEPYHGQLNIISGNPGTEINITLPI